MPRKKGGVRSHFSLTHFFLSHSHFMLRLLAAHEVVEAVEATDPGSPGLDPALSVTDLLPTCPTWLRPALVPGNGVEGPGAWLRAQQRLANRSGASQVPMTTRSAFQWSDPGVGSKSTWCFAPATGGGGNDGAWMWPRKALSATVRLGLGLGEALGLALLGWLLVVDGGSLAQVAQRRLSVWRCAMHEFWAKAQLASRTGQRW